MNILNVGKNAKAIRKMVAAARNTNQWSDEWMEIFQLEEPSKGRVGIEVRVHQWGTNKLIERIQAKGGQWATMDIEAEDCVVLANPAD